MEEEEEEEEGFCVVCGVMSSSPVILKCLCLPRCWRGGPGSVPAGSAGASRPFWEMIQRSLLGASWGCRGAGAGQEEGPKASKRVGGKRFCNTNNNRNPKK